MIPDIENAIPKPYVFLDWDDTLLPSYWIMENNIAPTFGEIHIDRKNELIKFENIIYEFLSHLINISNVIIITNAEDKWVQMSAERFIPSVCPLLEKIEIYSARNSHETKYPSNPEMWKINEFSKYIRGIIEKLYRPDIMFNVLSIGDSLYERDAIHTATLPYKNSFKTKSFKLIDKPNINQLTKQIELLHVFINYMLEQDTDFDLIITIDLIK